MYPYTDNFFLMSGQNIVNMVVISSVIGAEVDRVLPGFLHWEEQDDYSGLDMPIAKKQSFTTALVGQGIYKNCTLHSFIQVTVLLLCEVTLSHKPKIWLASDRFSS